jgi:hypothetical protein
MGEGVHKTEYPTCLFQLADYGRTFLVRLPGFGCSPALAAFLASLRNLAKVASFSTICFTALRRAPIRWFPYFQFHFTLREMSFDGLTQSCDLFFPE